jgi:hypothetical protein
MDSASTMIMVCLKRLIALRFIVFSKSARLGAAENRWSFFAGLQIEAIKVLITPFAPAGLKIRR